MFDNADAAILGIDAAWTHRHPSGVALLRGRPGAWRCIAVAPSCARFLHTNANASVGDVIARARQLVGAPLNVVAVDMPLAHTPIIGRRACDTAISHAFGAAGCSAHSPTPARPGRVADDMLHALQALGFELNCDAVAHVRPGSVLEVYPHPAILRLLGLVRRLEYKVSRSRLYWPGADRATRISRLLGNLRRLEDALAENIEAIPPIVPAEAPSLAALKPIEDTLDALACAYVGVRYWEGKAEAYGDASGCIWVPARGAATR